MVDVLFIKEGDQSVFTLIEFHRGAQRLHVPQNLSKILFLSALPVLMSVTHYPIHTLFRNNNSFDCTLGRTVTRGSLGQRPTRPEG